MKRLFEIQTLSENQQLGDPITIITGGLGLLTSMFPSIFGGGRKRLTMADWLLLLPGNGYWTTALRGHLKKTIHYDNNLDNIQPFTKYFVHDNQAEICPGMGLQNAPVGRFSMDCFTRFLAILKEESFSGGTSPVGQIPGGYGTINWQSLIPFALGGLVLILMMKKKK